MATSSNLGQIEARNELRRRGLIVRGELKELRLRLLEDDAFGEIEGNLANSSDQQLRAACKRRGISSRGKREELIETIIFYNRRKRSDQSENEDEGPLNIGLPKPDDRLGPPTGDKVLGTPESDVHHGPYHLYLENYENKNNTKEGAWSLQYWLLLHNRDLPSL